MDQERRWQSSREHQSPPDMPLFPHRDSHPRSGASQQHSTQQLAESRRLQQPQYSPQTAAGYFPGPNPSSPSYSFGQPRTQPRSNNMDNITPNNDAAPPSRLAPAPGLDYLDGTVVSGEMPPFAATFATSAQNARPNFRVQIPPTPPANHDTLPSVSVDTRHRGGSIHGAPPSSSLPSPTHLRGSSTAAAAVSPIGRRPGDYDMLSSPVIAQGYGGADPYFSPHIPVSKQQSLYRMQTHASVAPNVEEKKHCCPHCNKRCVWLPGALIISDSIIISRGLLCALGSIAQAA